MCPSVLCIKLGFVGVVRILYLVHVGVDLIIDGRDVSQSGVHGELLLLYSGAYPGDLQGSSFDFFFGISTGRGVMLHVGVH